MTFPVSFFNDPATLARSVFADHGPIAKPPLVLQSGATATITSPTDVTLPGGAFGPTVVGKTLVLTGTALNAGKFLVLSVLASNKLRLWASFDLPDPANGVIGWQLTDPRDGVIADSPLDVTVKVNGFPITAQAVSGLRGQVVLPSTPTPTDRVQLTYSWIDNPKVEVRSLNDPQFTLNGGPKSNPISQHTYKYQNVLVTPSNFVPPSIIQSGTGTTFTPPVGATLTGANLTGANVGMLLVISTGPNAGTYEIASVISGTGITIDNAVFVPDLSGPSWTVIDPHDDIQARLSQPLLRDIKYRAYERKYTALLNDPNLLVLNSPTQRIAYPPLSRQVNPSFISYNPITLPEVDPDNPWSRIGTGTASIVGTQLVVTDNSSDPFPAESQVYWTRPIDVTFPHAFAVAWRIQINADPVEEGVFTGVAVGYANDKKVLVVGYLDDGVTRQIGILKRGSGDDPSDISAWIGGILNGNPTNAPIPFDWSIEHSYRIFEDRDGVLRVFVDGEVVESLRALPDDLPFLEELPGPFSALEGVFFGSISRAAQNTSTWDFIRYEILPLNPLQTAVSSFVSYEGDDGPEVSVPPWTPVGSHGTETIIGSYALLLDSTSATVPATETDTGLVGGDFRGFMRIEPLLAASSNFALDVGFQLRTFTHGVAPNAAMAAIDDGDRLMQVCFFPDRASPKYSYGGRQLPETWTPTPWTPTGGATAAMHGRRLRITDTSTTDGLIYSVQDAAGAMATTSGSHVFEFRVRVNSFTADPFGFGGVTADAYNGFQVVGVMFRELLGVRYLTLHSDGAPVIGGDFAFEWDDGAPHTIKVVVNIDATLVVLFADGVLVGSVSYAAFSTPPAAPPIYSWGSSTASSSGALSVVDWYYSNIWNVYTSPKRYVGIWKGTDPDALTGYHLPLLASGTEANISGNALGDPLVDFTIAGVIAGDYLVVDDGPNKGVYPIASVAGSNLTISTPFPLQPSVIAYRIPRTVDWTANHQYRLVRSPGGDMALLIDSVTTPLIRIGYSNVNLPPSSAGILRTLSGGLPCVAFGAFDPTNLSETFWDFVRYGIVRPPFERAIVPPHQVQNQRNVIASPEHLRTTIPHPHTDFWSSSTGIPPQTVPDFLRNPGLRAYTLLNERTPPVPVTQTSEIRHPVPITVTVSALNDIADVLNNKGGFVLNDPTRKIKLFVPDDVVYNSIQVIETATGEPNLLTPGDDRFSGLGPFYFQKETCLIYTADTLPENDTSEQTQWVLQSDNPAEVSATIFNSVLTYGTGALGTKTIYKNPTPLPDSPSFATEFKFKIKLLSDASFGLGDSQVRFGFSAPGLTIGLGFVTTPIGDRYIYIFDLNSGAVVGGMPFDFLDGNFHTYRLVYDPGGGAVNLFIDA